MRTGPAIAVVALVASTVAFPNGEGSVEVLVRLAEAVKDLPPIGIGVSNVQSGPSHFLGEEFQQGTPALACVLPLLRCHAKQEIVNVTQFTGAVPQRRPPCEKRVREALAEPGLDLIEIVACRRNESVATDIGLHEIWLTRTEDGRRVPDEDVPT